LGPRAFVLAFAIAGVLFAPQLALAAGPAHHHRAVIFVHGFEGSGSQFESQQMRLTSNGYRGRDIRVLEYNSLAFASAIGNPSSVKAQEQELFSDLDKLIAHMKAVTHRSKVDLLAHSLGTRLMQDYLESSRERAASVAHYVNIDGFPAGSPPGGVPTLALWGTRGPLSSQPGRRIKGAKNVFIRGATHVQCATSPRSFAEFFKFFNGRRPKSTEIVRQRGAIKLSGRALNFPQNSGLDGATVQVWRINQSTGQRIGAQPIASKVVGPSGTWGPVTVTAGRRYELTLVRTDNPGAPTHHFYYEPFVRSDHLVRLLESDAIRSLGGPADPRSAAMVIIRYKELWGDQGSRSDVLKINGTNACNSSSCPLDKLVNALFVADFNRDGQSEPDQTWPPYQNVSQYFLSSTDVFAPAANPPTGKVTVAIRSRGKGPLRTLTFPNWVGVSDVVSVQLDDFDKTVAR
jgi:pimeloyl-ACP methyl ester carboxylesterase